MIRIITAYVLSCYFLIGSIILPLGDFSLVRDLPQMYKAYQKLAPQAEQGVVDFVGDYLLNGKAILGHNKHDTPERGKSNVQYQHAATFCSIVSVYERLSKSLPVDTSDFHGQLFRPPLHRIG
jgi:hypothetical protein